MVSSHLWPRLVAVNGLKPANESIARPSGQIRIVAPPGLENSTLRPSIGSLVTCIEVIRQVPTRHWSSSGLTGDGLAEGDAARAAACLLALGPAWPPPTGSVRGQANHSTGAATTTATAAPTATSTFPGSGRRAPPPSSAAGVRGTGFGGAG